MINHTIYNLITVLEEVKVKNVEEGIREFERIKEECVFLISAKDDLSFLGGDTSTKNSWWAFYHNNRILKFSSKSRGLEVVIDENTVIDREYLMDIWNHIHTPDKYVFRERDLLRIDLWKRIINHPEMLDLFTHLKNNQGVYYLENKLNICNI